MQSLINLILSTLNSLINSFGNMQLFSTLNLFELLLITGIVAALIDVIRRLAHD